MKNIAEFYVIFDHPSDYPKGYVTRRFTAGRIEGGGADIGVKAADQKSLYQGASLVEARKVIPKGKKNIGPHKNDDPVILEVWR